MHTRTRDELRRAIRAGFPENEQELMNAPKRKQPAAGEAAWSKKQNANQVKRRRGLVKERTYFGRLFEYAYHGELWGYEGKTKPKPPPTNTLPS